MIEGYVSFASLWRSEDIKIQGYGLSATVDVAPQTLLLSIQHRDTICHSNIPQTFKQQLKLIDQYRFISKQTQIQKTISIKNELLLLYLIHLRHTKQQTMYKQWFQRPLTAMYFYSRQNIELAQNYDLLIDYVAEHNHIKQITNVLYNLLNKMQLIQFIFGTAVTQQYFTQNYEWSYHFINNRSFGYTQEYTLIPTFDMINHSALNANVAQLLSNSPSPTNEQLQYITSKQSVISYQSDNESDDDSDKSADAKVLNHNFYYHIVSTEQLRAGEEILLEYGNRNNKFFMEGYGFVEKGNPYDSLIIYVDNLTDRILYDSVKGQGWKYYKLKRQLFDFDFLIDMKKHYYQKFYKKDPSKAKLIWSKPKTKQFQIYFLSQLIKRMIKYEPQLHVFDYKLKGANQLAMFESQRLSIYRTNVSHLSKLLSAISDGIEECMEKTNITENISLPVCLQEYLVLLKQL